MLFEPGAATKDTSDPPEENNGGLIFANDGVRHECGWNVYIPEEFRDSTPQKIRFDYTSVGLAVAGIAKVRFRMIGFNSSGVAVGTLKTVTEDVNILVGTIAFVDLDVSSVVNSNTELLLILMDRDSSVVGDTLAASLLYFGGRSL